jgi:hypothetical protein
MSACPKKSVLPAVTQWLSRANSAEEILKSIGGILAISIDAGFFLRGVAPNRYTSFDSPICAARVLNYTAKVRRFLRVYYVKHFVYRDWAQCVAPRPGTQHETPRRMPPLAATGQQRRPKTGLILTLISAIFSAANQTPRTL